MSDEDYENLDAREMDRLAESITQALTRTYPTGVLTLVVRKLSTDLEFMDRAKSEELVIRLRDSRAAEEGLKFLDRLQADAEIFGDGTER